jgi:hypothetical protein
LPCYVCGKNETVCLCEECQEAYENEVQEDIDGLRKRVATLEHVIEVALKLEKKETKK